MTLDIAFFNVFSSWPEEPAPYYVPVKQDNKMLLLLLSHFSATPQTAAHQAPLSVGFSRQEYWSELPFPSPMHACMLTRCFSCVRLCATPWRAAQQSWFRCFRAQTWRLWHTGLPASWHVGSSGTRDLTDIPFITRQIPDQWNTREAWLFLKVVLRV